MQRGIQLGLGIVLILIVALVGLIMYLYPGIAPIIERPYAEVTEVVPPFQGVEEVILPESSGDGDIILKDSGPFRVPEGFGVQVYADGFNKPRALIFDSAGHMLVSDRGSGFVWAIDEVEGEVNKRILIDNSIVPHGLAIRDGFLYVASRDMLTRYPYDEQQAILTGPEEKLFDIPYVGGHFTRSLQFDRAGDLYVSIGSSCNVCEEEDERIAAIVKYPFGEWENYEIYARGLRNAVFFVENPNTGEFWATENGRDWLGDDLPPEEINIVREGKDYGWPLCYGNNVHDFDFDDRRYIRNPCEDFEPPVFEMAAHQAPLGLRFIDSPMFPEQWQGDLLVAFHGSWNSSIPVGYKIVRLAVEGNEVSEEFDFMTGFISDEGVLSRPVDLNFGHDGALYVTDDKSGVIYRVFR